MRHFFLLSEVQTKKERKTFYLIMQNTTAQHFGIKGSYNPFIRELVNTTLSDLFFDLKADQRLRLGQQKSNV